MFILNILISSLFVQFDYTQHFINSLIAFAATPTPTSLRYFFAFAYAKIQVNLRKKNYILKNPRFRHGANRKYIVTKNFRRIELYKYIKSELYAFQLFLEHRQSQNFCRMIFASKMT